MSYIDGNLMRGEEVIFRTKLHWVVYVTPVFLLFFSAAFPPTYLITLPIFFVVALSRWTSEFAVTNKRVVVKVGFISRKTLEMLLPKVETLSVDQGIFGRIFGYGTIKVMGTGGSENTFKTIAKPILLRRKVYEQIDQQQPRPAVAG